MAGLSVDARAEIKSALALDQSLVSPGAYLPGSAYFELKDDSYAVEAFQKPSHIAVRPWSITVGITVKRNSAWPALFN